MPTFDVDIADKTYEVDAPDERTAWAWANRSHQDEQNKGKKAVDDEVASMRQGSALKRGARGAMASLQNTGYGLKGIVSDLTPEQQQTVDVNKRFLDEDTAGFVGGLATDVASFAVPGGFALKGARMLPAAMRLARAAPLLAPLAGNAALDAGLAAAYAPEDRGEAALAGGIGSVGGQLATRGLGRVLGGLVNPSEYGKKLMQEGIQPTIGQAADTNSIIGRGVRKAEEIMGSVPVVGGLVNNARQRATNEFAEKAVERAVPPNGTSVGAPSREAFEDLKKQFNKAYSVLDDLEFNPDKKFEESIVDTIYNPDFVSTTEQRKFIENFVGKHFFDQFRNKTEQGGAYLSGKALKEFDSKIGERLRDLSRDGSAEAAGQRRILTQIDKELTNFRNRQITPELAENLKSTDTAYANYKRVLRAGSYIGAEDGNFTPAMLQRAVKASARTQDDFARGGALMQDLSDPGQILKNKIPNSGTADRLALISALAGLATNPIGTMGGLIGGGAAAAGLYSRPVQKALLGGYGKQKAMQDALRRYSPYAGDLGASFSE